MAWSDLHFLKCFTCDCVAGVSQSVVPGWAALASHVNLEMQTHGPRPDLFNQISEDGPGTVGSSSPGDSEACERLRTPAVENGWERGLT